MSTPLFKKEEFQKALKKFKSNAKPNMFYYTEKFALAAKKILDTLMETKTAVRVRPIDGKGLATIRLQFYQGVYYLLDHLDPTGVYKRYFEHTRASIVSKEYVKFSYREKDSVTIETFEVVRPWRDDFMTFLDNAGPNAKFYRKDVSLSSEDIAWINGQLLGLVKKDGEPLFFGEVEVGKPLLIIRDKD